MNFVAILKWITKYKYINFCLILTILLLTTWIIFYKLGTPQQIIFDETYYIPSAQKYINGVFFLEAHPPLGKLLIALGEKLYNPGQLHFDFIGVDKINQDWPENFDITGFRISSAFFGVLVPLFLFFIIEKSTKNRWLAFGFALFLCFDTAFLMQARIAMLDVFILFFVFLSALIFLFLFQAEEINNRFYLLFIFLGITSACATSVKENGLIASFFALVLFLKFVFRRNPRILIVISVYLMVFIVTYLGIWAIHFGIAKEVINDQYYGIPETQRSVIFSNQTSWYKKYALELVDAIRYEINYNDGVPPLKLGDPNEIGSPWYEWILGGKAIDYRWETPDGIHYSYSYLVGNPITWFISFLGVIFGTSLVLSDLIFKFLARNQIRISIYAFVSTYWAYMIPFWFINRVMYLYHYLPAMVIGLIVMALFLSIAIRNKFKLGVIIAMLVILAIIGFLFFKPFVYYEPLTQAEFNLRNFWPIWQLKWAGN